MLKVATERAQKEEWWEQVRYANPEGDGVGAQYALLGSHCQEICVGKALDHEQHEYGAPHEHLPPRFRIVRRAVDLVVPPELLQVSAAFVQLDSLVVQIRTAKVGNVVESALGFLDGSVDVTRRIGIDFVQALP